MHHVGYARVSSVGQSLETQLDKLKDCDKIFQEKISGTTAQRPELKACLDYVRKGDVLIITKLDRLARSTADLYAISKILEKKEVSLRVLDQAVDTTTPEGRAMFGMLGVMAQFENDLRAGRQAEGIKKAQEKGVIFGRKSILTPEQIIELKQKRDEGVLIRELRKEYGLSKTTIYRLLGDEKEGA